MSLMARARELQDLAGGLLYAELPLASADATEWMRMQRQLDDALNELEHLKGDTPDEEGELLLAILMGCCVTVRNETRVAKALERAERVLQLLTNPVLKCKLAAHCYLEVPDEELLELVRFLMEELKRSGRGNEVLQIEQMMLD